MNINIITSTLLAWVLAIAASAGSLRASLTIADIEKSQLQEAQTAARWLQKQDLEDPETVMNALREKKKDLVNYSLIRDGMKICHDAAIFGQAKKDPKILTAAATFADALLRKHVTPSGAFVEWDRNTWLDESIMWRTIPWGVAFCGNRIFEAWRVLKDDLSKEQQAYWRRELEKTGTWIYKNPVVGGYVYNACIDLCGLLWRIGHEFNRADWCQWALTAAEHRIRRDIDEEGWIQAEEGGSSGHYQLYGASMLARFAWESKAPVLEEAVRRIFARSALPFSTTSMDWPGNYGTRTSGLERLPGTLVLAAAAFGDPHAAYFVQSYGQTNWQGELDLWRAALSKKGTAPVYPAVTICNGIATTVVRKGPWVAYFGNYDRSTWARGFMNLWHGGHSDWVFSTLHSLAPLSGSVKAKSRLGDTSDWAGFPHVRVTNGPAQYDSQRRIASLETSVADGVTVKWTEPLLDGGGQSGGSMSSSYRFYGQEIELQIDLRDLVGASEIDFHFLRRPNGFIRLWIGSEVADIFAGRFLRTQGHFDNRNLKAGQPKLFGVQVDRTVFGFEAIDVPTAATMTLVKETENGLHTGNLGGFRYRITLPATERNCTLRLRLRATD